MSCQLLVVLSGSLEGGLLNEEDGKINKAIVAVLTDNGHTAMARSNMNGCKMNSE